MKEIKLKTFFIRGKGGMSIFKPAGYAWVRTDRFHRWCEFVFQPTTRTEAEYLALISLLEYVRPGSNVLVMTDARRLVDHFSDQYRSRAPLLRELFDKAKLLISTKDIDFEVRKLDDWKDNAAEQLLSATFHCGHHL